MIKIVLAAASTFALVSAAAAADLPRREPAPAYAGPVGKAPIGKGPIGKGPIGKGPIGKAPAPIYTKG